MSHLKKLTEEFVETTELDQKMRIRLVLEMIEYGITYPPQETIEPNELKAVKNCVHQLINELEYDGEHLFADRIHKLWKKREHLLRIAENAHRLKNDYMDDIEYHEEIKWIRDQIEAFA